MILPFENILWHLSWQSTDLRFAGSLIQFQQLTAGLNNYLRLSGLPSLFVETQSDPSIRARAQGLFIIMANGVGQYWEVLSADSNRSVFYKRRQK